MDRNFSDFMFDVYATLLGKAAMRYRFVQFGDSSVEDGRALWRHDIDFSPHRALAMAEVEGKRGVRATYFVQLTSPFYNAFESGVTSRLRRIAEFGHDIGIHFEPTGNAPEERLVFEARTLQASLDVPVRVFSLHNPTIYDTARFESSEVAGLINASAPALRRDFVYCSDSNGLWRYRSLMEVIEDMDSRNIYVLTHPEWWQDEVRSPRERISRCIDGRAEHCHRYYDGLLEEHGRPNVGRKCDK
ncbi:MAG: hypothetical protein WC029_10985 [Sulfuricella sp.]